MKIVSFMLQIIAGYALSFVIAIASGIGNGWELLVFGVGSSLGVWGVGALFNKSSKTLARFIGTLLGAAIGIMIILITPPMGFIQVFFSTVGALAGYYFLGSLFKGLGGVQA